MSSNTPAKVFADVIKIAIQLSMVLSLLYIFWRWGLENKDKEEIITTIKNNYEIPKNSKQWRIRYSACSPYGRNH